MTSMTQKQPQQQGTQASLLECHICFNSFNPNQRRPKVLKCQHRCCSECLDQMLLKYQEIHCPWCRYVTKLPHDMSVKHLPDDQEAMSTMYCSENSSADICMPDMVEAQKPEMGSVSTKQDARPQTPRVTIWSKMRMSGYSFATQLEIIFYCMCCVVIMFAFIIILLVAIINNFSLVSYNNSDLPVTEDANSSSSSTLLEIWG